MSVCQDSCVVAAGQEAGVVCHRNSVAPSPGGGHGGSAGIEEREGGEWLGGRGCLAEG